MYPFRTVLGWSQRVRDVCLYRTTLIKRQWSIWLKAAMGCWSLVVIRICTKTMKWRKDMEMLQSGLGRYGDAFWNYGTKVSIFQFGAPVSVSSLFWWWFLRTRRFWVRWILAIIHNKYSRTTRILRFSGICLCQFESMSKIRKFWISSIVMEFPSRGSFIMKNTKSYENNSN